MANLEGCIAAERGHLSNPRDRFCRAPRHGSSLAFAMSAFDHLFEVATSVIFLIVGLWGTAFACDIVGAKIVGGFHWNLKFRVPLRCLGPLLVVLCVASVVFLFRRP
jgi:hypothetical protein